MTFQEPWFLHAISVAQRLHHGRTTRKGAPYWTHCEVVARKLVELYPDVLRFEVEAAVLHAVLENGRVQPNQLRGHGINASTIAIIQALTRDHAVPYPEWVKALIESRDVTAMRIERARLIVTLFPNGEHAGDEVDAVIALAFLTLAAPR